VPHYHAQVLARAQSAALTTRPFAERLVLFWTNHFAISADKGATLFEDRDLRPTIDLRSIFNGVLDEHLDINAGTLSTRIFPASRGARPLQGLIRA
jgi:hypothetical protein